MLVLHNTAGTSWSRPAVLRDNHDALVNQLVRLSATERGSLQFSALTAIWNRLLEKATRVEWNALTRLAGHWEAIALSDFRDFADDLRLDLPLVRRCRSYAVQTISTQRRISRLRQLQAILRAKLLRRIDAEGRGRTRLSLSGSFNCLTRETGSAAATARRMFPLGAPPASA